VAEPAADIGPLLLDQPPSVSTGGLGPADFPHQQEVLPEIIEVDDDELPPAKRMRPAGEPISVASCPPAVASGTIAASSPCGESVDDAEKAALEARKAAMLKSLQTVDASKQPPAPGLPPARPAGTVPPGQPLSSTAPSPPSAPSMPPCPAGATPEQYEAWRKQCWHVYYEWCSVWQKYYTQNQSERSNSQAGAQSKARAPAPGGGCTAAAGRGRPPAPPTATQQQQQQQQHQGQQSTLLSQAAAAARGRGAAMASWPPGACGASRPVVLPPMPRPDAMVAGRPKAPFPLPAVRSLIEDDIHGKLLGL